MMKTNRLRKTIAALGAAAVITGAAALTSIFAEPARAQQPPASVETPKPSTPAADTYLSLSEIERRVTATGVKVMEIEVKDRVVEVEGRDSSNREIDLLVDRRSGEILSRKVDD